MLCTTDLCGAPLTCVVHHSAQGGPISVRSDWCTRQFCMFIISSDHGGAQYAVVSLDAKIIANIPLHIANGYEYSLCSPLNSPLSITN